MQRLKTRAQFDAVLQGKRVASSAHFVLHQAPLALVRAAAPVSGAWQAETSGWGALVPKRWARRAVTRNAIRRQIYSLIPLCAQTYPQAGYVVRMRCEFDRHQFPSASSVALKQAVRTELRALFEAALRRLSDCAASATQATETLTP
ncbi:MAG: hypothetical protein Fur007_01870 [Rhodoferax sp.]